MNKRMRIGLAALHHSLPALVLIAVSTFAEAQAPSTPAWSPESLQQLCQLQSAALIDDYAYQQLAHLCDNIGPRPSGSLQAAAAVEYVAEEMRKLGLEVTLEKVLVPRWIRGDDRAELVEYPGQVPGTNQKIVVTALGAVGVTTPPEGITAEVIVVNTFDELTALPDEKVRGKIVLFNEHFDDRMAKAGHAGEAYGEAVAYRSQGRVAAERKGAVAMLVRSVGGAEFRLPNAGATDYQNRGKIPAAAVTAEDAGLIARLSAQALVRIHVVLNSKMELNAESYNVIADLKGSEHPEQVVIVSGHLDSWDLGTGALDDGAGVAVAMATAHLINQLHLHPARTLRIVAWMSEEEGAVGAIAYGRRHAPEINNYFAGIETDSGAGHPIGTLITGDPALQEILQPIAKVLESSGAGVLQMFSEPGTDLIPLNVRGMPAFQPLQDVRTYFDYHHTAADTLDKVDPKQLRENTAVVSVLAYALAEMKQELPRKTLPIPENMK